MFSFSLGPLVRKFERVPEDKARAVLVARSLGRFSDRQVQVFGRVGCETITVRDAAVVPAVEALLF